MTSDRLAAAVAGVDAPAVVFAASRHGRRTIRAGGYRPGPLPPESLRYETGSVTKTFTALLLATLAHRGRLSWNQPADPARPEVTLLHLATHTAGLPRLPADFYPVAIRDTTGNPYARYPAERVVAAFRRQRLRHRPGTRWRYSNFGAAMLGHALAAATATPWDVLLEREILRPLKVTTAAPDATGHRRDGRTPVPPLRMGGFQAAGAVRATPEDLLRYLEAQLRPEATELAGPLRVLRRPLLRRGLGHRHLHTAGWFVHPTDHGPAYFHSGATSGQQIFLGFRPATGTALAAMANRRIRAGDTLIPAAHALLCGEPD